MRKKYWLLIVFLLFIASRIFIWLTPPPHYSDVKADYERYANMWYYGLTPYREHLYEYPPATIPLLLFPLILDQKGIGKYYPNYRAQILIIDIAFFIFLSLSLNRLIKTKKKYFILSSYIFLTSLCRAFFYEGIDLAFTASICVSFLILLWKNPNKLLTKFLIWAFFWLSTAIKFITFPLIVPLYLITKTNLKKDVQAIYFGFLTVWAIPLLIFRSSLSASFAYNLSRPIKYASFPAHIIRWIDFFTNTETQINKAPDFQFTGPISQIITQINKYLFPLMIFLFLFWAVKKTKAKLTNVKNKTLLLFQIYLIYLFILFLAAKTFSQPFHIWYLAPVSLLASYLPRKKTILALGLVILMLLLDMTEILHIPPHLQIINGFPFAILRDTFRFLPMFTIPFMLVNLNWSKNK